MNIGKPSETSSSEPVNSICMNLTPEWIAGFTDGEGCFHISINSHAEMTAGYQILPEFTVVQHRNDIQILYALKSYFKCGVVRTNHGDRMAYRVRGLQHHSEIIVPFFMKHQLKTKKRVDFEKFRDVVLMMQRKEHLTAEGIEKIKAIASDMNRKQVKIKSDLHGDMQRVEEITTPSSESESEDVTK
jgi:hypothetical protein